MGGEQLVEAVVEGVRVRILLARHREGRHATAPRPGEAAGVRLRGDHAARRARAPRRPRSARTGSRGSCPRPRAAPRRAAARSSPEQGLVHAARGRRAVQRVEVDARRAARRAARDTGAWRSARPPRGRARRRRPPSSSSRWSSAGILEPGESAAMRRRLAPLTTGITPGTIGTRDPRRARALDEAPVVVAVEEELRDQELRAGVDLALQAGGGPPRGSPPRGASPDSRRRRCRSRSARG